MPPRRQTSVKIAITPYEDELLLIAVRLDSAIRHWEKQLEKNKAVDAAWMKEGMGNELVSLTHSSLLNKLSNYSNQDSVADIFLKQHQEQPTWSRPHAHPIVSLVVKEFKRSELEDSPMDPTNMSIARSKELCQQRRDAFPNLSHHLSHKALPKLLKQQGTEFWWMPGIPDPDEEEEEEEEEEEDGMLPLWLVITLLTTQSLELQSTGNSNPEFTGGMHTEDQHAEDELRDELADDEHAGDDNDAGDDLAEEEDAGDDDAGDVEAGDVPSGEMPTEEMPFGETPSGDMLPADDSGAIPMDEDEDDANVRTPRVSRTQKRTIVPSPADKDKRPMKQVKYDRSVCTFFILPN